MQINIYDDNFRLNLLEQFRQTLPPSNCVLCDTHEIDKLVNHTLSCKYVVVGLTDHFYVNSKQHIYFDTHKRYNNRYYIDDVLYRLISNNPSKQFYIFQEHFNPQAADFTSLANVKVFDWGLLSDHNYVNTIPVTDKNFQSTTYGVSLMRRFDSHRLLTLSYITGLGLHSNCLLTGKNMPTTDHVLDLIDWDFEGYEDFVSCCQRGYTQLKNNDILSGEEPYVVEPGTETVLNWCNAQNFDTHLRHKYKNTFVEFILETTFHTELGMVTEKFKNSVYGMNFSIMIGIPGTVEYLRSLGFDMFDDIIDHSYDTIAHPARRLKAAVDLNQHLISQKVVGLWKDNINRFHSNVNIANNELYTKLVEKVAC
jgi:hypothetical protein